MKEKAQLEKTIETLRENSERQASYITKPLSTLTLIKWSKFAFLKRSYVCLGYMQF